MEPLPLSEITLLMGDPWWQAKLVWALFIGWAGSSYTSNFSYRLPRDERIFGRDPYCGECNTLLQPKDLAPIFSWLSTGGKCRYCGARIPASYVVLELLCMFYIGLCFAAFGYGDGFITLAALGFLVQISLMMAWDDDHASPRLIIVLLMLGFPYRLLNGDLVLDGMLGAFYGLIAAAMLYSLLTRRAPEKDIYQWPRWMWLLAACGSWLQAEAAPLFAAVAAMICLLLWHRPTNTRLLCALPAALLITVWWQTLL